jgi:hypothetical protein
MGIQMPDPIIAGATGAASTLKAAQGAGAQLGSVVSDQQNDMERAIQQQHKARVQAKLAEERRAVMLEVRAVEKYEQEKSHQRELEKLKQDIIRKHGKNAWVEVEALKSKMQKEAEAESKLMDHDRQKQIQVFWWCMTASALITYFFKLYKI